MPHRDLQLPRQWRRWQRRTAALALRLSAPLVGTLVAVEVTQPLVALTFDDGPHPHYTERMVELLARHRAHATFFLQGERVARYPDMVRRLVSAGHQLGNHGWDHPSFTAIDGASRRRQLLRCRRLLGSADSGLFRPPFGHQHLAARLDAALLGYRSVTWSHHISDWSDIDTDERLHRLQRALQPGAIILLHDAPYREQAADWRRCEQTLTALEALLAERASHYRFVTIGELLRHGRPRYRYWSKRGD